MGVLHEVRGPADIYDKQFVPALFQQWGPIIAELAGVREGDRVLDVACGTGVLACAALERIGSSGRVAGLDPNPEMLAVARRKSARIEWREGRAEAIPFSAGSFDAVISQFGLMFFEDRPLAVREMMRVLRAGGRLIVAVCDAVERSPGYAAFADLLQRLFGAPVAEAFRAPFVLGNADRLLTIWAAAGVSGATVTQHTRSVCFPSIEALVSTERACVWTLGSILDNDQFARLLAAAEEALEPFVTDSGRIVFDMPALVVRAIKG